MFILADSPKLPEYNVFSHSSEVSFNHPCTSISMTMKAVKNFEKSESSNETLNLWFNNSYKDAMATLTWFLLAKQGMAFNVKTV